MELDYVIIDCRFYLSDTDLGHNEYLRGHIPSAIYAHLDRDLTGTVTSFTGRHPLPNIEEFIKWIIKNKINRSNQIIVYDQSGGGIAARLWWMLTQLDYKHVAVLEGGIIDWKKNGYPLTSDIKNRDHITPEMFERASDWSDGPSKLHSKDDIQKIVNTNVNLIDSRSPERYSGHLETIDPVAGHIPSAVNIFWESHLQDNLKLKSVKIIKDNFEKVINSDEELIFYCGSGVTAAFNVLVAKHLDIPTPGIYIGSWSEWIRE